MSFYAVYVGFVGGFTFNVDAYAQLLGILLVYACFFEFVWAEAFLSSGLFAVLFGYDWFYVMHLFASLFLFVSVSSRIAKLMAWAKFFCTSAAVVETPDVFASASHATEDSAGVLHLCYPANVFVGFYG